MTIKYDSGTEVWVTFNEITDGNKDVEVDKKAWPSNATTWLHLDNQTSQPLATFWIGGGCKAWVNTTVAKLRLAENSYLEIGTIFESVDWITDGSEVRCATVGGKITGIKDSFFGARGAASTVVFSDLIWNSEVDIRGTGMIRGPKIDGNSKIYYDEHSQVHFDYVGPNVVFYPRPVGSPLAIERHWRSPGGPPPPGIPPMPGRLGGPNGPPVPAEVINGYPTERVYAPRATRT